MAADTRGGVLWDFVKDLSFAGGLFSLSVEIAQQHESLPSIWARLAAVLLMLHVAMGGGIYSAWTSAKNFANLPGPRQGSKYLQAFAWLVLAVIVMGAFFFEAALLHPQMHKALVGN